VDTSITGTIYRPSAERALRAEPTKDKESHLDAQKPEQRKDTCYLWLVFVYERGRSLTFSQKKFVPVAKGAADSSLAWRRPTMIETIFPRNRYWNKVFYSIAG
jgi:hypothetical protein